MSAGTTHAVTACGRRVLVWANGFHHGNRFPPFTAFVRGPAPALYTVAYGADRGAAVAALEAKLKLIQEDLCEKTN